MLLVLEEVAIVKVGTAEQERAALRKTGQQAENCIVSGVNIEVTYQWQPYMLNPKSRLALLRVKPLVSSDGCYIHSRFSLPDPFYKEQRQRDARLISLDSCVPSMLLPLSSYNGACLPKQTFHSHRILIFVALWQTHLYYRLKVVSPIIHMLKLSPLSP